MGRKAIRVLVIDDSAYNRRAVQEMLATCPDVAVVGTAADGEEGLKLALSLRPDVVTLDLDMPRMDGFSFLRLLMAKAPIPVIVVSGYAKQGEVFKAMELGAVDFIAKPSRHFSTEAEAVREQLVAKISAMRHLRRDALKQDEPAPRLRLAVLGASTGGPPALGRLLSSLPGDLPLSLVIAQHMPERFTRTFAERLDRTSAFDVAEACQGDSLAAGRALVAPGGHHVEISPAREGFSLSVTPAGPSDKHVPSVDRLFASAARLGGIEVAGVLLTGMGRDGREGMVALSRAGAFTVAESEESAVIYGMPKEAVEAGAARRVLPLEAIAGELVRFGRGGRAG